MSYTPSQLYYAALALRNFAISINPLGGMVPWKTEEKGALLVLNVWDRTHDALACGQSLYDTITAAGYGAEVTLAQCDDGANAVLAAAGVIQTRPVRPPAAVPPKAAKQPLSSSEIVSIKKKYEGI